MSKDWYDAWTWWYYWLLISPLVLVWWWLVTLRTLTPASLMISAAAIALLVVVTATAMLASVRFLHGIAWLSVIGLASIVDLTIKRLRAAR